MMKTCPHCRASIEEDARFCLYCMTSLDDKHTVKKTLPRTRTLWPASCLAGMMAVAAGVLVIIAVLTVTIISLWQSGDDPITPTPQQSTTSSTTTVTAATTTTMPSAEPVIYRYRTAEYGRDYYASADIPEDAVIITEVCSVAENGVYVIPETLDGHPVITVAELAFSNENIRDTVKTVVFPASVRTVEYNAFAACTSITDVYLCGDAIYIAAQAFESPENLLGTLTIHASAECHNRRFQYYKDMTVYAFEEWNGGDVT